MKHFLMTARERKERTMNMAILIKNKLNTGKTVYIWDGGLNPGHLDSLYMTLMSLDIELDHPNLHVKAFKGELPRDFPVVVQESEKEARAFTKVVRTLENVHLVPYTTTQGELFACLTAGRYIAVEPLYIDVDLSFTEIHSSVTSSLTA